MAYGTDCRDCECVWVCGLVGIFVDEMSGFVFGGAHFPGRGTPLATSLRRVSATIGG